MIGRLRLRWWSLRNFAQGYRFGPVQRCRRCDHTTPFHYQTCVHYQESYPATGLPYPSRHGASLYDHDPASKPVPVESLLDEDDLHLPQLRPVSVPRSRSSLRGSLGAERMRADVRDALYRAAAAELQHNGNYIALVSRVLVEQGGTATVRLSLQPWEDELGMVDITLTDVSNGTYARALCDLVEQLEAAQADLRYWKKNSEHLSKQLEASKATTQKWYDEA